MFPVLVGGGTRFFRDGVDRRFELVESGELEKGMVHSHYRMLDVRV